MRLDITHLGGPPKYGRPAVEVMIDGETRLDITHIDLKLDAEALPVATIEWACTDGVNFSGDVIARHVCPLAARAPGDAPAIADIRKALRTDIEVPLSYEADTHEIEAYHTLREAAKAYISLIDEDDR